MMDYRRVHEISGECGIALEAIERQRIDGRYKTILELYCGTGFLLAEHHGKYAGDVCVGVDPDWRDIVEGRVNYGRQNPGMHLLLGDPRDPPFRDNSFDTVWIPYYPPKERGDEIRYMEPTMEELLAQAQRVAKVGGEIRVITNAKELPPVVRSFYTQPNSNLCLQAVEEQTHVGDHVFPERCITLRKLNIPLDEIDRVKQPREPVISRRVRV